MEDDWNNRATELDECVMTSKASVAHRCSNVIMSINAVATVLYFIDSYARRRTVSEDGQFREFPVQALMPFDAHESPTYEFVVLGLFFHVLETAVVVAMLNALILTLVSREIGAERRSRSLSTE